MCMYPQIRGRSTPLVPPIPQDPEDTSCFVERVYNFDLCVPCADQYRIAYAKATGAPTVKDINPLDELAAERDVDGPDDLPLGVDGTPRAALLSSSAVSLIVRPLVDLRDLELHVLSLCSGSLLHSQSTCYPLNVHA